jgi:hypothetical protein
MARSQEEYISFIEIDQSSIWHHGLNIRVHVFTIRKQTSAWLRRLWNISLENAAQEFEFLESSGINYISIIVFVHIAMLTGSVVERELSCLIEREHGQACGPRRTRIDLGGILSSFLLWRHEALANGNKAGVRVDPKP